MNEDFSITISGKRWSLYTTFASRFDFRKPKPSRAVFLAGFRKGYREWTFMVQLYRPRCELDWHVDGGNLSNRIWSLVLWKPKTGGELEIDGPHKRWWRFYAFDGGLTKHRVTPCGGYRLVCMVQSSRPTRDS